MSDIVIDTVQVALFVDNFKIGNSILLANKLSDIIEFDSSLDVNTMLSDDAPGEIVRINAKGKTPNTRINISKLKISLYWENSSSNNNDFSVDKDEVVELTKTLCKKLVEHNGSPLVFSRVGYITTVYKKCSAVSEISQLLKEKFPSSNLLNDVQMTLTYDDIEMGEKIGVEKDIKFNKYIKVGTGRTKSSDEEIALVQHDLNTRQSQALGWSIDMVEKFIRESAQRSKKDDIYGQFFR